jgi:hypothetical protein
MDTNEQEHGPSTDERRGMGRRAFMSSAVLLGAGLALGPAP